MTITTYNSATNERLTFYSFRKFLSYVKDITKIDDLTIDDLKSAKEQYTLKGCNFRDIFVEVNR